MRGGTSTRPKILDLFCGAGGGSVGYHRAGFEVVGVDIKPQPRYPFEFHQADALTFPLDGFDVIHASPPCQSYSVCASMPWVRDREKLIEPIRARLQTSGLPYVIENVPGSPLLRPIMLCGLMFNLKVFRHRLFETNVFILAPDHIPHAGERIGKNGFVCVAGHGDSGRGRIPSSHRVVASWKTAMAIDWMTRDELREAIPPAYTEYIGRQLINLIRRSSVRNMATSPSAQAKLLPWCR